MNSTFKILVLEDSSSIHKLYQKYFEFLKFEDVEIKYLIVTTLEDAKKQCDVFRPDCMLVDLEIDNTSMAGLKVSEFYDVNNCAVFSGLLDGNNIVECNKNGFFIFVQKPFKFEILKQIIYSFYLRQKMIFELEQREEEIRRRFQENIIIHETLKEQYFLQDLILSTIPASVYIKDFNLRYVTCNNKFLEINNISNIDDIIGKTDFDIFPPDKAKKYSSEDEKIILDNKELTGILNSSSHRQTFIWTTTSKYPIYIDGKVSGMIGIIIDITENVRLEKILENTFDAIKDGICIVGPDKKIVKVNSTLIEWFSEYQPLVGKNCNDVFGYECGFCEGCPGEKCTSSCQVKYKEYWFDIKYYPINHSGYTICYRRDITTRKLLEEQRKKEQHELEDRLTVAIDEWVETSSKYDNSLLESVNLLDSKISTLGDKKDNISKKSNFKDDIINYFKNIIKNPFSG